MPVRSERDEPFAPASPIRLGQPYLGARAGVRAVRLVAAFYWRATTDSARAAFGWFWRGGWAWAILAIIFTALFDGIGEKGVHVLHEILAGLAGAVAVVFLYFLVYFGGTPLRLIEEERRRLIREARAIGDTDTEPPASSVQLPPPHAGPYEARTPEGRIVVRPLSDDEAKPL
jgi:hypothetical protein